MEKEGIAERVRTSVRGKGKGEKEWFRGKS